MVSPYEIQLLRAIVATQLRRTGFDEASSRAVDVLTDILIAYLHRLGSRVKSYAEHATRTMPTPLDLLFVFDEFRISIGDLQSFAEIHQDTAPIQIKPTLEAKNVELYKYINPASSMIRVDDTTGTRKDHIPPHFPLLPSAHTYLQTPITLWNEESDPIKKHEQHAQQAKQAEDALVKLYRASLVARGTEEDSIFSFEAAVKVKT
ncbi:hypothetical protein SmJEL517_g04166 [Synchytrium microbalum]|uniref:Transcription initiation factor TFIID subunit 8 n=1 Tax=Synchytrium microbalum TaxID=1806994 RepID=A0A507C0D4_9FUNG|nr:uncharacterized protein SmJEL517_g04166 [Synchytrium microbalum]TPX32828.1 hypothetical protein SmJEL517_g04166 [Synchytrium microbalum]